MSGTPRTPSQYDKCSSNSPSALQKHVEWWDPDNDGVIWPRDVFNGFRALGFGLLLSIIAPILICGTLSYFTGKTWYQDPAFRIYIAGIHKAKHGSDSEVYTRKGGFDEDSFEQIFKTYADPPNYDSLTLLQLLMLSKGNADPYDIYGQLANFSEWTSLYLLIWPEDGRITKAELRALYDGSIFQQIAKKRASKRKAYEAGKIW